MSSNFGSSKEAKISRQMNRSQKLKRKNTCEVVNVNMEATRRRPAEATSTGDGEPLPGA